MIIRPTNSSPHRFIGEYKGLTFFGRTRGQVIKNALLWISANLEAANGQ